MLLTAFYDPYNDNNFWNFRTIFWGAEGLGEGCVKIALIVSFLEWLTCLLFFITVEFEKLLFSPDLKMLLIFLVTKIFQKGTMFKWVYVLLSHEMLCQVMTSSPRKNCLHKPHSKSPFGDSCSFLNGSWLPDHFLLLYSAFGCCQRTEASFCGSLEKTLLRIDGLVLKDTSLDV